MKNAKYCDLFVNKPGGVALVKAGSGIFLVTKSMYVEQGRVQVEGEKFEILDSLILNDTLSFTSRVQDKILHHLKVNTNAFLDNSYGIDLQVKGNVEVQGNWENGKRSTVYFNKTDSQNLSVNGSVKFDKLILSSVVGNKTMKITGMLEVSDSVILDQTSAQLDSAELNLSLNATLFGESEQNQITGVGYSVIKAHVNLDSTRYENIAGLGYAVYSDTAFGKGMLTRGFDAVVLSNGEFSIDKSYLLELTDSARKSYQTSIKYFNYELQNHQEDLITLYFDNDYSNAYRLGLSTLHSQFNKVAFSGVKTGTKVTLGKMDLNPLPVELLSFEAKLSAKSNSNDTVNLTWEVASEINTTKYSLYVSEDGINYELLTIIDWVKSSSSSNKYSFRYALKSSAANLYYKLYEHDLFGKMTYLAIDTIENKVNVSVVKLNGQEISFPHFSKRVKFLLYSLNGREIMRSNTADIYNSNLRSPQMCVLCAQEPSKRVCQKIYLK